MFEIFQKKKLLSWREQATEKEIEKNKRTGRYWIKKGNGDIKMHIIAPTRCAINMLHILSHYISCTRLPTQSRQCQKSNSAAGAPQTVAIFEGCVYFSFFIFYSFFINAMRQERLNGLFCHWRFSIFSVQREEKKNGTLETSILEIFKVGISIWWCPV